VHGLLPHHAACILRSGAPVQHPGLPKIYDIHSWKSQSARTKAAENFRDAKSAILLSSDVARGMDFPGYVWSNIEMSSSLMIISFVVVE
jgi:hypothetical protein